MEKISLCNREITFNEAFKLFITAKERDGLSAETVKTYKIMIKVFTDYAAANLKCQDITKEVFDKYKDYLMQTRSNYILATDNRLNTLRNIQNRDIRILII